MRQQIFNKMYKQQQFPQLLSHLNNLPLHLLLTILPYLDPETKLSIKNNSTRRENNNQTFLDLIQLSLFTQKYLTATDRSVYMSFYSQPTFLDYENILIGEICVRDAKKYLYLEKQIQQLFKTIRQQIKNLQSSQSFVQILQNAIRDPQLPLPRMRKEGIAMFCNSSLQFGLVDLRHVDQDGQQDQYVQDCILDLEQFLESLQSDMVDILSQRKATKIKGKNIIAAIKQCYYHPQLINIQNYKQYLIKQLTAYNLYIQVHALISGVAQIFHQYIIDQGKEFQRFIQFILRYSIYRSILLTIQESKISRILYSAIRKIIQKGQQIYSDINTNQGLYLSNKEKKITQFEQIVEDLQLQNKKSRDYEGDGSQLKLIPKRSKMESQKISMDIYRSTDIQMTGRLFITGGKIWINQCRKIKQKYQQSSISPSKYIIPISQQKINSQNYIKILNRLSYNNIVQKLTKQIQQQTSSCQKKKSHSVLRDEDIINVFGHHSNNSQNQTQPNSPTYMNHSFTYSAGSLSPQSSMNSEQIQGRKKSGHNNQSHYFNNALLNVQNKIRMQPFRPDNTRSDKNFNDTISNSPQKQGEIMGQVDIFNLKKIPSLKQRKLYSRASMLSKFSKITEIKGISYVQDLLQSQINIQEQILMDFISYLVDLSVNQSSVHWCGHSEQPLMGDYYRVFQDNLLKYNQDFMQYLSRIVQDACSQKQIQNKKLKYEQSSSIMENINFKILRNLIKWHLQYLDVGYLLKSTIKKLLKKGNEILHKIHCKYEIKQKKMQFQPILLNIDQINKMIQHYNEQMWRIQRNVSWQKLKIYQERRFPRNIIHMNRFQENQDYKEKHFQKQSERCRESVGQKQYKKIDKRRRNSQQISPMLIKQ